MRALILVAAFLASCADSSLAAAQAAPETVTVGIYVNDIQAVDLRANSYVLDVYVWFRWKNPQIDPAASFEFMNTFDPEAHVRTVLYETPKPQPDGSLYQLVRHQGAFSQKFPIHRFPFDEQQLLLLIEDSESSVADLVYVPDKTAATLNAAIALPGFTIGAPRLDIANSHYPTDFGDLADAGETDYSRAVLVVPISRPVSSGLLKTFVPIWLIMIAALLALFLDPEHVEARIGLAVTSLLALVAMQFTQQASLPEVAYLTLTDQAYLASFAYVILVIAIIVRATRRDQRGLLRGTVPQSRRGASSGPLYALALTLLYVAVLAALFVRTFLTS